MIHGGSYEYSFTFTSARFQDVRTSRTAVSAPWFRAQATERPECFV